MRDFMKLTAFAGALAFVVWGAPACGGDDDSEGGGKKTGGGTGGGVIGGTGGTDAATGGGTGGGTGGSGGSTGGTAGTGGGVTTITCGTLECPGYSVLVLEIPPCCAGPTQEKCGADVPALVADFIGVPAGCYETEQEGPVDTDCPTFSIDNPLGGGDGGTLDFPGCCNTATSVCGNVLDTSQFGGPNFGCANLPPPEGGAPQGCGATDGGGGTAGAASDAGPDAPADAASSG